MSRIRRQDTKPEMIVRRLLHSRGYRYRLHCGELPGRPDLVFPGRRKVIFVHGCFWHRHENCALARMPKSRLEFWQPKLEDNRDRDRRKLGELEALGWTALVVWECELRDPARLVTKMEDFLDMSEECKNACR